jgi:hypothetical protein
MIPHETQKTLVRTKKIGELKNASETGLMLGTKIIASAAMVQEEIQRRHNILLAIYGNYHVPYWLF